MMKGQKGITLVALIITIIVMLILVGVSISVALNGGLFTKANTAVEKTRESQIEEAIVLAKAEVLSQFYAEELSAFPKADTVLGYVNEYLEEDLKVTLDAEKTEEDKGIYVFVAPAGVVIDDNTIDVQNLDFKTVLVKPAGE